jgi:hypothetical protein
MSPAVILPLSETLKRWLAAFCDLHELYRQGTIGYAEKRWYRQARDELAQLLLRAQGVGLRPGQIPRKSLRVAVALEVTVHLVDGDRQAVTEDISSAGLCLVTGNGSDIPPDVRMTVRLDEAIVVAVRSCRVDVVPRGTALRIGFRFEDLSPDDADRIETKVFDIVVGTLKMQSELTGGPPTRQ